MAVLSKKMSNSNTSASGGGGSSVVSRVSRLTAANLSAVPSTRSSHRKSMKTEVSGLCDSRVSSSGTLPVTSYKGSSSYGSHASSVKPDSKGMYTMHAPNGGVLVIPLNTVIKANWKPLQFYPNSGNGGSSNVR